ncbi:hypothetical protein PtB15_11B253 [Puccinia triticina]|nr:hypothetical protein PtB15_11B253 [Puccinia triticina]
MPFGLFESRWSIDQIPDLAGKVAIVTGGNSGLGFITCLELARKNARVYMASRSRAKAEDAIQKIKAELAAAGAAPPAVEFLEFDLATIAAGKAAAAAFLAKEDRLDMLINNAGIMATPYALSADGIELQACNATGHYALTIPLLPVLRKTAEAPGSAVRIVNLASIAHRAAASKPDFSSLEALNRSYSSTWIRYGNSKLANILFNSELQRRLEGTNIHCLAVHPGVVDTDLFRGLGESFPLLRPLLSLKSLFRGTILISPQQGALTQLYAATSPDVARLDLKGKYLVPYAKVETPSLLAQDPDHTLALQFWTLCESLYAAKI